MRAVKALISQHNEEEEPDVKIRTKRALAAILALMMALSLAACGDQAQQAEADSGAAVESAQTAGDTVADTETENENSTKLPS